jgi:PAS domain S-box-containing protein
LRRISLRTKILGALLGVGLLTLLVTGWQSYRRAESALRNAAMQQLTSVREERRLHIEAYFADVRRDARRLAELPAIATALMEFKAAYRAFETELVRRPQPYRMRQRAQVERYYEEAFWPRLQRLNPELAGEDSGRFVPVDDVAVALQELFIANNPNPEGARARLDRPAGGGRYADVHATLNPALRAIIQDLGYEDLFLVDHKTGQIVYTVAKRLDFATSLLSGPYRDTKLSRVFRAARTAIDADFAQIVDFQLYVPSLGAPAAFVAAPVFTGGHRLGVLALRIPLERIDAVMTGDRKWKERGFGRTGESYLIGEDHRMRSDARRLLEAPEEYLQTVAGTGVLAEAIDLMREYRSTVLLQPIATAAAGRALSGDSGTLSYVDHLGHPVFAAYAPVTAAGLHWGIVAKVDVAEALAPAIALRRALVTSGIVIAVLVAAAAIVLARSLTAPIHRLIGVMNVLGRGDLSYRVAERRGDEIGQIAAALNRMASDLQETTVSRDHVNSILDSMSDAVMVVRPPDDGADWARATIVTANPAACAMLGRPAADIVGRPVGSLVSAVTTGGGDGASGLWLEEVAQHGRVGAREVVYKVRDGREIPVLFSGAVMRQGTSEIGGIVCAAHDLTELKATEARASFIRETFGRYISDDVVATLLSSPDALALGGELRRVTVMMTDLRGFTALIERLTPQDAIAFLNGYLQTMVDLILHYQGTINEILGDGILVIFGAPTAAPDDAERAVACAVAMQLAMDQVNAKSRERGLPEVEMGIGIHTGDVIVGNIGSNKRMKYAAVGTHVNLTGRIESYTVGGQILISDSTQQAVSSVVNVGRRYQIEAKGAQRTLTAWEVTGIGGAHGLFLQPPHSLLVDVVPPIPVDYAVLEGKHVGQGTIEATIIRLSEVGAEIRSPSPPPALSNVKIRLSAPATATGSAEIYAKVVEQRPGEMASFIVRFTSIAPEAKQHLVGLAK